MLNKPINIFRNSILLIVGIFDLINEDLKRRKLGRAKELAFEIAKKQPGIFTRTP